MTTSTTPVTTDDLVIEALAQEVARLDALISALVDALADLTIDRHRWRQMADAQFRTRAALQRERDRLVVDLAQARLEAAQARRSSREAA